ncbi:hypothetical protein KAFR_0B02890 [Kazachstania africana CBS 2517]|uniref:Cell division control protein 45 n=1 Tax=Kazachstania africana (strain ATCC 22294 / BCRC 22015 / CBS 2517 / CECT 1963 / NBRC 1671 / NRRL Y-8276) TaxID=1071382 RepID=H2AQD6_KAZAF|nr:hypothetical protein KAFR_0B02890 [Kazachstania africana CBS 2517]CCF56586.1 hypothetical protein KAFR_0B02890 [Kazachstania africana CBS 2517]
MYYSLSQYKQAFNEIIKNSSSPTSCKLVIFVSCLNIDALCATKLLSYTFKKQLVQLQIIPIFGYSELKLHYSKLDDNINSVILVGFGGFIDVETFLDIEGQEREIKRTIYVLDGHRPWNLDNLFGSDIVKCFDDGTVEDSLDDEKSAYFKLLELEGEADQDSQDDGSYDTEDSVTDEDERDQDDDDDTDDEESNDDKRKRSHPVDSRKKIIKQRKKMMHQYENTIQEYYSQGTTVVNSISSQVYSLLSSIGETNLDGLWLTILGVTSLDNTYSSVYNRLFPLLQDEVKRLSPSSNSTTVANGTNPITPDALSLEVQPDYYLFLLRHSSLYDSFYYSNFVNAKLSLWNENGKKRLHKMFARMGISLTTAHEHWIYMDHSIKRELGLIFERNLDRYGLQDIVRDGFVRTFGYRGSISASEFVEAITSLLEVGSSIDSITKTHSVASKDPNNNDTEDTETEQSNIVKLMEQNRKQWISNFWLSWDALDDNKIEYLQKGLKHAQFLQKAVFNTGVAILEKRLIKHLRIYRLCVLQDGPDLSLYQNPLTLLRLGNWLIECCAESEDKQLLPMVLASLSEATDTYLVAGLSPRYPRGLDMTKTKKPILNNFAMAFQQITAQTGAKVKIDNFESAIIEIRKDDLSPFLEKLTLSGLV